MDKFEIAKLAAYLFEERIKKGQTSWAECVRDAMTILNEIQKAAAGA